MRMGSRAAPQQYSRMPGAMCHILQRLAGIPVVHHLDDFIGIERAGRRAASTQNVVRALHDVLGAKRNVNKSVEHNANVENPRHQRALGAGA